MTAAQSRIDVRPLPTWERHPKVFAAFDQLGEGATLVVVTDHEPRPLRAEFERRLPHAFTWSQCRVGEGCWEARIRTVRSAAASQSEVSMLRRSPLFAEMSAATEAMLAGPLVQRTLQRGETLFEQDVAWPYLGILIDGTLDVVASSPAGREHVVFEIAPFETCGDVAAFDGGRTTGRAVATSSVARVFVLPREAVLAAVSTDDAVACAAAFLLAQRTRALVERLTANIAHTALQRVAEALLPYASPDPGLRPVESRLTGMTQSHLARVIGSVKEVVARAIGELESAGALERRGGHIVRVDREKLLALLHERE